MRHAQCFSVTGSQRFRPPHSARSDLNRSFGWEQIPGSAACAQWVVLSQITSRPEMRPAPVQPGISEPAAPIGYPPADDKNRNGGAQCPPRRQHEISDKTQRDKRQPENLPFHRPSLQPCFQLLVDGSLVFPCLGTNNPPPHLISGDRPPPAASRRRPESSLLRQSPARVRSGPHGPAPSVPRSYRARFPAPR